MFNLAGLGGSFDHLHEGHKILIQTALTVSRSVVIGLTTGNLLKDKKFSSKIQDYQTRKKNLLEYLESTDKRERVTIIKLNEPYGPPVNEKRYEALVVSQETYKTGLKMNEIRKKKGYPPLILVVIPLIKDEQNKKLSSTTIRRNL